MIQDKLDSIREQLLPLVGHKIQRFETAEILLSDGTWSDWPDLPIRLFADGNRTLSISWSQFDQLWMAEDDSLPFDIGDATARWQENAPANLEPIVGKTICGASIGRGEMTIEGKEVPIWTRLLIDLGDIWLEIFNALDENGYAVHHSQPDGEFQTCT